MTDPTNVGDFALNEARDAISPTTPAIITRSIVNAARSLERARSLAFESAKAQSADKQDRRRDYANARNVLVDALMMVAHRSAWVRVDGVIYSTDLTLHRITEALILDLTPPPPEPPQ